MYEFDSVSVSTFEASSLAAKLTEKAGDGWDVVAIVPAGSDVTAFLKRETTSGSDDEAAATSTWDSTDTATAVGGTPGTGSTASEPSGWGSEPAAAAGAAGVAAAGSTWGSSGDPSSGSSWGSGGSGGSGASQAPSSGGWGSTAATAPAPAATTPAVPAGWYSDPAGRFELRYWDGSAWTEHVSRAGQQYTDPPVA